MEYQRNLREWIHHGHVVALTAHYILRNRWCSSSKIKVMYITFYYTYAYSNLTTVPVLKNCT